MPVILHIPHASTLIPDDVRPSLTISDDELRVELLRMTDMHTDAIFGAVAKDGDALVQFPVSRLVLDPERFVDDADEPMATRGMGVVYTRRHDGSALRANHNDKARLVRAYYNPHHAALAHAVNKHLVACGAALIPEGPEICVGTDTFHTPDAVRNALVDTFKCLGYSVSVNAPFAGTLVSTQHFRRDGSVASVMIELRRDLYMNETTGAMLPRAEDLTADVVAAVDAARLAYVLAATER